jgi:hypothetical protein
MKDGATYPEYIGVSDVTTRSAEQLNFDLVLDTKESTGRLRGLARETHRRAVPSSGCSAWRRFRWS